MGWARLLVDFLQETWPPSQGRAHVLYNAGVAFSGNYAEPFLECWSSRLPPRFDLALVETHVHDSHVAAASADVALEHLLRRLLAWGGETPTVVLTHFFNWCQQPAWFVASSTVFDTVCRAMPHYNRSATSLLTPFPAAGLGACAGGFEDTVRPLAAYYNLPTLSLRNSMFTWLASNASGAAATWPVEQMAADGVHPADSLQRAFADILVHWVRLQVLLAEWWAVSAAAEGLPPPTKPLSSVTDVCHSALDSLAPTHPRAVAAAARGFSWADDTGQGKMGWVATMQGSSLALTLDTRPPPWHQPAQWEEEDRNQAGGWRTFVGVELLHSYQGMGAATLSCSGGCTCEPVEASLESGAFSLPSSHHVLLQAPADGCVVTVTSSKAGKVKVTGVTIGRAVDGATIAPVGEYLSLGHPLR